LQVGANSFQWADVLVEGELEPVLEAWGQVMSEKKPLNTNIRMKRLWTAPDLDEHGNIQTTCTHLMLTLYPDFDQKGEVITVMSCVTDIR